MRILFAGSPDIAAVLLNYLLKLQDASFKIVGVLTNPPAPQGRKSTLVPTPVEQVAREYNSSLSDVSKTVQIFTPDKLDASVREKISQLKCDLLVCFAYGKIFGPKFMALFPFGGINIHPSLLPKFRGCAPIPAAILAMEKETGITIQRLAQEMDCGDILAQKIIPLDGKETSESLLNYCATECCGMIHDILNKIADGKETSTPQKGKASYCSMLKKEDGQINWSKSAKEIDAQIRAFFPWPGAFTKCGENILHIHSAKVYDEDIDALKEVLETAQNGQIIKNDKKFGILVKTGNGVLKLENLQWQTKKAMPWKDFINGNQNLCNKVFE
ncbi:MAG: methionyl-tRNA formyltransferase [Treponema sp.]|nr:methionyl-tRNA formyltransferase [Treponema sp.]